MNVAKQYCQSRQMPPEVVLNNKSPPKKKTIF